MFISNSLSVESQLVGNYNAGMTSDVGNTGNARNRLWGLILWTLRVTVVLQCVGNWRWLTQIVETPLLHWLLNPTDIGGLAWSESTALAIQQVVGWLVLVAAGSVLWRPHVAVLALLVFLQSLITVAMWQIAEGYSLQASWAPPQLLTLFPFATQLARIAAPLGLMLLGPMSAGRPRGDRRIELTMRLLRWALAIVFLAHGIEAWQQNPKFVDLLINSTQRTFGLDIAQSTAEQCLTWIGIVDIVLAFACVSFRWLTVLWWMTFWAGATTISRLAANGWEMSWHEALARVPHIGVALAVVLWWHLLKWEQATTFAAEND